jgi:hypothetical protein
MVYEGRVLCVCSCVCANNMQSYFIVGTSEGAGSAASLPGFGVSPKNSFSFFLPAAAGGELENEIALNNLVPTLTEAIL